MQCCIVVAHVAEHARMAIACLVSGCSAIGRSKTDGWCCNPASAKLIPRGREAAPGLEANTGPRPGLQATAEIASFTGLAGGVNHFQQRQLRS